MPRSYQKKRLANESSERLSLFSPAAILIGFAGRKDEFWISHRSSSLVFYSLLADLVLISHLMFILFILAGGLLALRWKRAACFHLPAAAWGVLIELADRICPLTPLENRLRLKAGELGYERGFIEHYLLPIVYPEGLNRNLQLALGGLVVVVNAIVYAYVLARLRRNSPRS
jgi:hypothetical protein